LLFIEMILFFGINLLMIAKTCSWGKWSNALTAGSCWEGASTSGRYPEESYSNGRRNYRQVTQRWSIVDFLPIIGPIGVCR
jgi:hypothetical protein